MFLNALDQVEALETERIPGSGRGLLIVIIPAQMDVIFPPIRNGDTRKIKLFHDKGKDAKKKNIEKEFFVFILFVDIALPFGGLYRSLLLCLNGGCILIVYNDKF